MMELYSKRCSRSMHPVEHTYLKLDKVEESKNGVLVKRSVFKEHDFSKDFAEIAFSDFALGNILAVGATHLLKPVMMSNLDFSGSANAFDSLYQKLQSNEIPQTSPQEK